VPRIFRNWAPLAWKDLMRSLPDEQDAPEIAETAAEQFRNFMASALMTMEAFGHRHNGQEREDIQRRSLIEWCRAWAKPGKWQSVRSLKLWTRIDEHGRLRIALNHLLFGQIRRPAPWGSHRKFAKLAELYDIGVRAPERPGGSQAVDLQPDFIAELLAGPVDGTVDGKVDGRVYTCASESVPSTAPSTVPSTESVKGDL